MPITFEEVSAEVTAPPAGNAESAAPAPAAPAELPPDQLDRALRLLAERAARISDR